MKRIIVQHFFILLALSALFFFESCSDGSSVRQPEEFMISVDSVNMPDTLAVGGILELQFYGTIGENQCYRFKRFIVEKNITGFKINTIGERIFPVDSVCSADTAKLAGRSLSLPVNEAGTYTIIIENPGLKNYFSRVLTVID